jgi:two-component system chemotaxis response regulator CheB
MSASDVSYNPAGVPAHRGPFDLVVIGASFGGPPAIARILNGLPRGFPVPIAIVQHMTPGSTEQWAELLDHQSALKVTEAQRGKILEPGHVYVAPAGRHLRFMRGDDKKLRARLDADFADSLHVPSIDFMMSSAAQVVGSHVLAALLTGMGADGAIGMLAVRQAGGYTLAESEETAQSYSMPGSAVRLGAIVEKLPIDRLAQRVAELGART